MKRDGILLTVIIMLIILFNGGVLMLMKYGLLALVVYVGVIMLFQMIKGFTGSAKDSKITKILERKKKVTYDTFSIGTKLAEVQAFREIGASYVDVMQNFRLFAIHIKAITPGFTGEMPKHLAFVPSKKILYELRRKYGESYSAILPKPSLTKADILRPLTEGEVLAFHEFCRNNPLCDLRKDA